MINRFFKEDKRDHITLLKDIDYKLARMNSLSYTFVKGMTWGLAGALGATIIAGVSFTIIARAVQQAEDIPILDTLIERSNLKDFIEGGFNASEEEPSTEEIDSDNQDPDNTIDSLPQ